ncbi:hypothetical protein QTP70_012044 [Hemibagrus guttatus]|uniref:Uncharacterized protein n=1 Tax=Hemibagrus guttatus TaxID=175788 RepID=A0AAE0V4B1_9TELE|nr:hypothetical protein QTP70_012044 [Hemibagrus guttatus]
MNSEISERLKALEKEVTFHKEESGKSKAEVDRLLGVLRELESERTEKDKAISELERSKGIALATTVMFEDPQALASHFGKGRTDSWLMAWAVCFVAQRAKSVAWQSSDLIYDRFLQMSSFSSAHMVGSWPSLLAQSE